MKQFARLIFQAAPRPWLRPLHTTLYSSGTALVRTLVGHTGEVRGVALSADGRRVVSASDDHTLKVWDLETGRVLRTLEGHSGPVLDVAVRRISTTDPRCDHA